MSYEWPNPASRCPQHTRRELERDCDEIIYAAEGLGGRKVDESFLAKWKGFCLVVVRSLREAGRQMGFGGILLSRSQRPGRTSGRNPPKVLICVDSAPSLRAFMSDPGH